MRRLICLLFVLILAKADTAAACSPPTDFPALEKLHAQASAVIVGHLERVEEAGIVSAGEQPPREVTVEGTFRVVEVLKGQPPANGKIRGPAFEACGPILWVGWDYLFFLDQGNFVPSPFEALPVGRWQGNARKHILDKLGAGNKD